jgi:hypothetical protein
MSAKPELTAQTSARKASFRGTISSMLPKRASESAGSRIVAVDLEVSSELERSGSAYVYEVQE